MSKRSMHPRPDTGSDQMLFQTGCICQRDARIPVVMLDLIYFGGYFFDMLHLSKMYDIAIPDQMLLKTGCIGLSKRCADPGRDT